MFGKKKPAVEVAQAGLLEKGMQSVADIIAPSSVEVDFKSIRVGEHFC